MPDWLRDAFHTDHEISLVLMVLRLAVSLLFGIVVAGVYWLTQGKLSTSKFSLLATLVLLTVLIAMVTMVIGNSVARAFSLVGALAIVRFRTIVEDTRDTAFVIFAVAVGMAVGAGFLTVPLIGIPFAAIAAFLFRPRNGDDAPESSDAVLTVRVGAGLPADQLLRTTFDKHLDRSRLTGMVTARQGAAFDLTYRVRMRSPEAVPALVTDLNAVEGVQNVELRRD